MITRPSSLATIATVPPDPSPTQLALLALMTKVGTRATGEYWHDDLPYHLWAIAQGGSRRYGSSIVGKKDVTLLKTLATKLNGWLVWRDAPYEPVAKDYAWLQWNNRCGQVLVPLGEWRVMYEEWKARPL